MWFSKKFLPYSNHSRILQEDFGISKMVQTRAGKRTVQQPSDSEKEEMNSPRLSRRHDSGEESDVDPAMYRVFQKDDVKNDGGTG